jgi:hypothetical protein
MFFFSLLVDSFAVRLPTNQKWTTEFQLAQSNTEKARSIGR